VFPPITYCICIKYGKENWNLLPWHESLVCNWISVLFCFLCVPSALFAFEIQFFIIGRAEYVDKMCSCHVDFDLYGRCMVLLFDALHVVL